MHPPTFGSPNYLYAWMIHPLRCSRPQAHQPHTRPHRNQMIVGNVLESESDHDLNPAYPTNVNRRGDIESWLDRCAEAGAVAMDSVLARSAGRAGELMNVEEFTSELQSLAESLAGRHPVL